MYMPVLAHSSSSTLSCPPVLDPSVTILIDVSPRPGEIGYPVPGPMPIDAINSDGIELEVLLLDLA